MTPHRCFLAVVALLCAAGIDCAALLHDSALGTVALTVAKRPSGGPNRINDRYATEKRWLTALAGTGVAVTQPLYFVDEARDMILAHAGEPVTRATLPLDWESQLASVLEGLRRHNCRHNDLKPGEILVDNGRLTVIDFGWASEVDAPLPAAWVDVVAGLGDGHRCTVPLRGVAAAHAASAGGGDDEDATTTAFMAEQSAFFDDACTLRRVMATIVHGVAFPESPVVGDFPCPSLAGGRATVATVPTSPSAVRHADLELDLGAVAGGWAGFDAAAAAQAKSLCGAHADASDPGLFEGCVAGAGERARDWVERTCGEAEAWFAGPALAAVATSPPLPAEAAEAPAAPAPVAAEGASEAWVPYHHGTRSVGSQSEVPSVSLVDADCALVGGYHAYKACKASDGSGDTSLELYSGQAKFVVVRGLLEGLQQALTLGRSREGTTQARDGKVSFTDLGCSGGAVSLMAHGLGLGPVLALDHDSEYVALVNAVAAHLGVRHDQQAARAQLGVAAFTFRFGDCLERSGVGSGGAEVGADGAVARAAPLVAVLGGGGVRGGCAVADPAVAHASDIVFCGALIHWVFSATARFGSFRDILEYLLELTGSFLLVEWVAPDDPAIAVAHHTSRNAHVQAEAYSTANFEAALAALKAAGQVKTVLDRAPTSPTRVLYVIEKGASAAPLRGLK